MGTSFLLVPFCFLAQKVIERIVSSYSLNHAHVVQRKNNRFSNGKVEGPIPSVGSISHRSSTGKNTCLPNTEVVSSSLTGETMYVCYGIQYITLLVTITNNKVIYYYKFFQGLSNS